MCKERFEACMDYMASHGTEMEQTNTVPGHIIREFKNTIQNVRNQLKSTQLHLPAIARQVEDLKNRLFSNLMQGKFKIEPGDITNQNSDAIINAANTSLFLGSGVAGAIRENGGQTVIDQCNKITNNGNKPLELGKVATTSGGRLKNKILHAAVMPWGGQASFESIRKATRNIILAAKEQGFKSISIPALGAGAGGVSAQQSAEAIKKGLYDMVMDLVSFDSITLVPYDHNTAQTFAAAF